MLMQFLYVGREFALQKHVVVKLVPVAYSGEVGRGKLRQRVEEETVEVQASQIYDEHEAG